MRTSDLSAHSEGEVQPLKKWFQDTYSREYLAQPHQSSFEFASMSFHSPFKSPGRGDYSATPRRRFRTTSLSPRYLSPIANHSSAAWDEEFVMGCSVCGTKAIDDAAWTYHDSPPRMRPSNRPELVDMDQENSGAYSSIISCRLHRAYSYLADAVNMKEIKLLEGKLEPEQGPFAVQIESKGATAQTTVVKEVFPAPAIPLTPLNYEEANRLKESLFHNSLAEKYVKEEERLRVATRRAEYANRVKGFSRVVEATKLKAGEDSGLGYPDSVEVAAIDSSGSEERKEAAVPFGGDAEALSREEPMEERKRPDEGRKKEMYVKAPSSFRTGQRHNTATVRSDKEVPLRSPAAESEDMTESTGKPTNSELARKKLEEIKKTVKQRREERKSRELKPVSPATAGKSSFQGRESARHPTGGSAKALDSDSESFPGRPKSNSVAEHPAARSAFPSKEPSTSNERKSAVIGAVPFQSEDKAPDSSEEEGLPLPQPVQGEALPKLRDEEGSAKSEENRESISPIPPIQPSFAAERPEDPFSAIEQRNIEEARAEDPADTLEQQRTGLFETEEVTAKPVSMLLHTPVPESAEDEEGSPVAPKVGTGLAVSQGQRLFHSKPPTPSVTSPRLGLESKSAGSGGRQGTDTREESKVPKKGKSQTEMPSAKGKSSSSRSPRPREASPKPPSQASAKPPVPGAKGKSAEGTPERSPALSPRPATERAPDLGFIARTGGAIRVGESQLGDSRASSTGRSGPQALEIASKPTHGKAASMGKTMQKQPRKKLASGKVSEISSFHRLQEEAAVLIQRAARQFLGRASRHKACQSSSAQYERTQVRSTQVILGLLEDSDVLAGLRMLGGFVEYLEARGLREL